MRLATKIAVGCVGICVLASCAAETTDPSVEVGVETQALCEAANIEHVAWINPDDGPVCTLNVTSPVDTFEYCTESPGYMSKFEVGVQFRASTAYVGMLNHNRISDGRLCRQGIITGSLSCSKFPAGDPRAEATFGSANLRIYNVEPEELYSQTPLVVLTCPPEAPFPVGVTSYVQDLGVNNFL